MVPKPIVAEAGKDSGGLGICKCCFLDSGEFWRTRSSPVYHKHLGACFQKSSKCRNEDICAQFGSDCHICDPFFKKTRVSNTVDYSENRVSFLQ